MKFRSVLFTAAMVVFTSSAANAAIVNYGDPITGGGENITLSKAVQSGQSGTIFTSPNATGGGFHAYLGNNSTITFSYNIFPPNTFPHIPILAARGGVNGYPLQSAAASTYQDGKHNFNSFDVFATANVHYTGGDGSTSITNHSGDVIPFSSVFSGLLEQISNGVGGTVGQINYNVSAVPLPVSVVMFGSAIAALFGFSYLSRQRKGVILQA